MIKKILAKPEWTFLPLIVILGGLIRVWGINWGLPVLLHPDEGTVVETAIRMAEHHSFEPDVFNRPDHLEIQLDMIVFELVTHLYYHSSFLEMAQHHKDVFYLLARLMTSLYGVGMIVVSYLIGLKINKPIGLIAAFLFAFFPGFIEFSHYATPDIPTGFFMLLCIYFCINYLQSPSNKNLALTCLTIAFFTVIKYPGLILCTFIAIIVMMQGIRDKNLIRIVKHGIMSLIMVPGFIFIISPVLFTNIHAVIAAFKTESNPERPGADGLGYFGNLNYYFQTYFHYCGIILALFFLIGVYVFLRKKISITFLPVFFSFIYFLLLSYIGLHWERWAVPMYVSPLLISAIGIYYSYSFLKTAQFKRIQLYRIVFYAAAVIVIINFSVTSVAKLSNFLVPDTRVLSQEFCKTNNINWGDTIFNGYTGLYPTSPLELPPFKEVNGKYYPEKKNIKYIALSSYMYERYISEPERFPAKADLYNGLMNQNKLIKKYEPAVPKYSAIDLLNIAYSVEYLRQIQKIHYSGPELTIYKVQ